jgi:hypothetical protein
MTWLTLIFSGETRGIHAVLNDEVVNLSVDRAFDSSFQISKMFVCPLNPLKTIIQRMNEIFGHLGLLGATMSRMKATNDEPYSDEEAARRMNDALRRALMTPPKPQATVRRPRPKKAKPTVENQPPRGRGHDVGA